MRTRGTTEQALGAMAVAWALCPALLSCDRAPPEPASPPPQASPVSSEAEASSAPEKLAKSATGGASSTAHDTEAPCIVPLAPSPPPDVTSLDACPADPGGRPEMPWGKVRFLNAPAAPELTVELALNLDDQHHGLMFRPQLSDSEGMLFSYSDEEPRRFWMHNTCLALDMIHIDQEGRIVGVVEHVPPWNDQTRTIVCPAMHVLEVPAGWVRRYGVEPGQRVAIDGALPG